MTTSRLRLLLAGALVAFSLPPWGWWPLALVGCAAYARSAVSPRNNRPFRTAAWWSLGWFVPSFAWMWWLNVPGYVLVCVLFAAMHGTAGAVASVVGRESPAHHRLALVVSHSLAEALRMSFPFGGVPFATLAISQAQSPFARLAPVGGVILITVAVLAVSMSTHRLRVVAALVAVVVVASPFGHTRADGSARFALVQGGGEQGTHAVTDRDPQRAFKAHLAATRTIMPGRGLVAVVWPENVANLSKRRFAGSMLHRDITAEASRLGVPVLVGITEDAGPKNFANAQVVVEPDGRISDRYDKKLRVPFGEWIPWRSTVESLGVSTALIPRDAVIGRTPAHLDVAGTRVAVAISWEGFFGSRVNEGVARGGRVVLNPSNGSSYTLSLVQSQQVASSRLRAREQGRTVMQVTPTGYSAFITPDGNVHGRTRIGEQRVIEREVELRSGRTVYSRTGNAPHIWALLVALALLVQGARRANRRGRS